MILGIDARSLAVAGAQSAAVALVGVNSNLEKRAACEDAQYRAHGADGVAVGSAAAPCQNGYDYECDGGYGKSYAAAQPHIGGVEGVAVSMLCCKGEQVVAPLVNRQKQRTDHTSVAAVWGEQRHDDVHSSHGGYEEHEKHAVAQQALFGRVAEAVFLSPSTGYDVLHDSQRTYHRTIDASQQHGEHDDADHHADVERIERGPEL